MKSSKAPVISDVKSLPLPLGGFTVTFKINVALVQRRKFTLSQLRYRTGSFIFFEDVLLFLPNSCSDLCSIYAPYLFSIHLFNMSSQFWGRSHLWHAEWVFQCPSRVTTSSKKLLKPSLFCFIKNYFHNYKAGNFRNIQTLRNILLLHYVV
jgi:hypothetical protein